MNKPRKALCLFACALAVAGPLFALPPYPGFSGEVNGWEGAPWGAPLSGVQARYGISAGTRIHRQDDFKIVMDARRRLDASGTFAGKPVDLIFHFDREDLLKAVTVESGDPGAAALFLSSIEEVLGRGGNRPLRGLSGELVKGEDRLWVRKTGTARLEAGELFVRLHLERRGPVSFPDELFAAFDKEDEESFQWYVDAGMGQERYRDFLMDEEGEPVEASICDYVLLALIEERGGPFARRCLGTLAERKMEPAWYPVNLVDWFLENKP